MNVNARVSDTRNPLDLIERARALVPALRERAAETLAARQLPQATVDDIRRLELTRCLQPVSFGGYGSDYRVFSRILRTLAQGCGSTAWVCAVHGEHNWVVGNFSEAAQRDVWGSDPQAVASASFPPTGSAEAVPGGHRIKGKWSFASGCDSASWLLLAAFVKGEGKPEERMFLIPKSKVRIVDDWHVLGLCGTGSKSLTVEETFVPLSHSVTLHDLKTGKTPGAALHRDSPLFRSPRALIATFSLTSVNVGLAERALDEFIAIQSARRSRGIRVADLETMQLAVAEAAAKVETAAAMVEQTIERNTALVASGEEVPVEQIALARRNSAYATRLAHEAIRLIFEMAGGTALHAANPLQEIFRDITAGASHVSLTWHRAAPGYGQIRLGMPVDIDAL